MGRDRMRYLVLGSVLLFLVLYLSRDIRMSVLTSLAPPSLVSWMSETDGSTARPRWVRASEGEGWKATEKAMEEKTALDQWIQSRLTQQGLKEMTESGHWQAEQAQTL